MTSTKNSRMGKLHSWMKNQETTGNHRNCLPNPLNAMCAIKYHMLFACYSVLPTLSLNYGWVSPILCCSQSLSNARQDCGNHGGLQKSGKSRIKTLEIMKASLPTRASLCLMLPSHVCDGSLRERDLGTVITRYRPHNALCAPPCLGGGGGSNCSKKGF